MNFKKVYKAIKKYKRAVKKTYYLSCFMTIDDL